MMKILIIRAGRTGDMVMMTPALRALLRKYPDAEFTFLTSPDGRRTLRDFSDRITRFWIYNREDFLAFFSRQTLKQRIADGVFDHIYCFEHNPSYQRLLERSAAKVHGFRKDAGRKHYCRLLLDVVCDGAAYQKEDLYVFLPVRDVAKKNTAKALADIGITKDTFLLAVHPTFSGAGKWFRTNRDKKNKLWPPSAFAELACRLRDDAKQTDFDLRILMNLMPDERAYGEKILQSGSAGRNCLEIFCPKPDFQNYKAFLERADLLLTPDTGPMHIAAALGTKIIALFAGRAPEDCGPFVPAEQVRIFRAEETARSKIGIAAIPVDDVYHACMKMIGLD